MTNEQIADFTSPAGQRICAQWWRQQDERLARNPAPLTGEETEAAVQRLADALGIDFNLAKGMILLELRPDLFEEFMARARARKH
jgi:hypothetical protein